MIVHCLIWLKHLRAFDSVHSVIILLFELSVLIIPFSAFKMWTYFLKTTKKLIIFLLHLLQLVDSSCHPISSHLYSYIILVFCTYSTVMLFIGNRDKFIIKNFILSLNFSTTIIFHLNCFGLVLVKVRAKLPRCSI